LDVVSCDKSSQTDFNLILNPSKSYLVNIPEVPILKSTLINSDQGTQIFFWPLPQKMESFSYFTKDLV
jgi:hypothetical protein